MGKLGCTLSGILDESKFSEPIPWIGLYAAAASAACALAMAADAFHGIWHRKFWFPCKFFSLNATTLTLITVATKLSVDLNTAMPRKQDQLAKLSSSVFICTVMGNFLPSLGSMENKELMMNMIALAIFIITVIANTCSPQFVMGRLATSTASGAVCLLSTVVLAEAILRSYLIPGSFIFCHGESDYKWSSNVVLVTQIVAIGVGSIGPAFRWFNAINFRCPKKAPDDWIFDFKVENYWIRRLSLWKEYPFVLGVYGRFCRRLVQNMKDTVLGICIWLQIAIVLLSKFLRLVSIYLAGCSVIIFHCSKNLIRLMICKIPNSVQRNESVSMHSPDPDLKNYVLHLEGEEDLIDITMKRNFDATGHWIRMGRKKQPKHLLQLIKKMESSRGFEGVLKFDSDKVLPLDPDSGEPPNCWSLPVVTLTSIVVALGNDDFKLIKELVCGVKEGLNLIRIVEDNLDGDGSLSYIRKAADMVWLGVELNYKWLDKNLHNMAPHRSSEEVLKDLASIAEAKFKEFLKRENTGDLTETPSKWPIKVLAANSMYRISRTLLLSLDSRDSNKRLFEKLTDMITDVMGACLTNLRHVISMQCERSAIEEREERVRNAIVLLGKTESLLQILDRHSLPVLEPDELAYIDEWRAVGIC